MLKLGLSQAVVAGHKHVMWFRRVNKVRSCFVDQLVSKEKLLCFRFVLRKQTRCVNSVNRSARVDRSSVSGRRRSSLKYSEPFKCRGCQRLWPLWRMLGSAVRPSLTAEMLAFPLLQPAAVEPVRRTNIPSPALTFSLSAAALWCWLKWSLFLTERLLAGITNPSGNTLSFLFRSINV